MANISFLETSKHNELPGVTIYKLSGRMEAGEPQEVLVALEPNGEIPLHKHSVDATMIIVSGSATVLSGQRELDGQPVARGNVVSFERQIMHGFRAGGQGLLFISRNGGIVAAEESGWDLDFGS